MRKAITILFKCSQCDHYHTASRGGLHEHELTVENKARILAEIISSVNAKEFEHGLEPTQVTAVIAVFTHDDPRDVAMQKAIEREFTIPECVS